MTPSIHQSCAQWHGLRKLTEISNMQQRQAQHVMICVFVATEMWRFNSTIIINLHGFCRCLASKSAKKCLHSTKSWSQATLTQSLQGFSISRVSDSSSKHHPRQTRQAWIRSHSEESQHFILRPLVTPRRKRTNQRFPMFFLQCDEQEQIWRTRKTKGEWKWNQLKLKLSNQHKHFASGSSRCPKREDPGSTPGVALGRQAGSYSNTLQLRASARVLPDTPCA